MSAPVEITAVGVRPMGEHESVSARVNGRVDTMIVPAGTGEKVARLLLAGPLVQATSEAAKAYLELGSIDVAVENEQAFERFFDRMLEVCERLAELGATNIGDELAPVVVGEGPVRTERHGTNPGREIAEAATLLYTGNRDGSSGDSIFRAVAVAGVALVAFPDGPKPVPYGTTAVDETSPESYRPLAAQLRELADGLDAQFVEHELTAAGVEVHS
jgi:hypothetical protein